MTPHSKTMWGVVTGRIKFKRFHAVNEKNLPILIANTGRLEMHLKL
jgi:hypothetical protein